MKKIIFIFPSEPLTDGKQLDLNFKNEWVVLNKMGFDCDLHLFDFDEFINGDTSSLNKLPDVEFENITFHRGWMFTDEQYNKFYQILKNKGYNLVNNSKEYDRVHYFPNAYEASKTLRMQSPKMIHITGKSYDSDFILRQFDPVEIFHEKLIVKDWVKSAKGSDNALVINNPHNKDEFDTVVSNMLKEREMYGFNKGIVFKKYVKLRKDEDGNNFEFRLFYYDGKLFSFCSNGCQTIDMMPIMHQIMSLNTDKIARELNVPFLTIDIAWDALYNKFHVIEIGEGGVSGMATGDKALLFYNNLFKLLKSEN